MAQLYFKVSSDWEEVVRLRNECEKLESQLLKMDKSKAPAAVAALEHQLGSARQKMSDMVDEAARAGATMENDFKKKIFSASQGVNDFTQKIIDQKRSIKDIEQDIRNLSAQYRKYQGTSRGDMALADYNAAKIALQEEKNALFDLTQQQAEARLEVKRLKDEFSLYKDEISEVADENDGLGISLTKIFAIIGGAKIGESLISNIVRVRGEFQLMDENIRTLLGSKEKADALLAKVKEFAAISPLELKDVNSATQMMLGFNIEAEKVPRFLQAIGDISMGEAEKFNSLTLAFSQMSSTGKLMGQDLNQMINAGFNPLMIMSEKTGKSIAALKKEMSAGAISAEMVQQAFIDATEAGGKFYNMSENAAKTINGQLSMMNDAIDSVYNEIGTKGEGVIMGAIQGATSLVKNYETIGKVLVGLVATYGTYRAAVMLTTVIQNANTVALRANAIAGTNLNAANILLGRGLKTVSAGFAAVNKTIMANPYAFAAAAVVTLGYGMYELAIRQTEAEKAQKKLNETIKDFEVSTNSEILALKIMIDRLNKAKEGTEEYSAAKKAIDDKYGSYLQNMSEEVRLLKDTTTAQKLLTEAILTTGRARNYDKMISDASGEASQKQADALTKIRDVIIKEKGKDVGEVLFAQIRSYMSEYDKEGQDYNAIYPKIVSYLNEHGLSAKELGGHKLTNQIAEYGDAAHSLRRAAEDAKSLFGEQRKESGESTEQEFDNIIEKVKEATETISTLKKELADLRSGKTQVEKGDLVKAIEDKAKELKSAEDKLTTLTGVSTKDSAKTNEKQIKEEEKLTSEIIKLRQQREDILINQEKDKGERIRKQIQVNYERQIEEIKKQEVEWTKAQGRKGLTKEQKDWVSEKTGLAEDMRASELRKIDEDSLRTQLESIRDYLKEYGTFQQKKLAIAEEYAEKIRKAEAEGNKGEIARLKKQQQSAIVGVETSAIKAEIDWQVVFGEFGGMFNSVIRDTLEKAEKYMKTDEFKDSDHAAQKELIDAVNEMRKNLGGSGLNFKKLGQEIQIYQTALNQLTSAKEEEIGAINKLKKATEEYNKALKDGTEEEKEAAGVALESAQQNADAASANVQSQTSAANEAQQNVTNTAKNLDSTMRNVTEGLSKLASGGIANAYNGLIQAGKSMGGAIEKVADNLESVPIIGWILSIIDVLKDGLSNLIGSLLDAIFSAVEGILHDVLSGDLFVTIFESIKDGIGKIFNAISFGGWNSLMNSINGGNAKETAEKIDKLTSSNDALKVSLDGLRKEIEKANGAKSLQAYSEALDAQKRYEENSRQILDAQMRYSGAHHSNAYYWKLDKNSISEVNKLLGTNLANTWDDFSKLTADQMNYIRTHLPDVWSEMINQGKYGDRFKEVWNDYADQAGLVSEMTEELRESLTQISFENLRDSFVDALMDMDAKAEDFADNFSEYMTKALLNFAVGDQLDDKLKSWYNSWAETMKAQNGKLTDEQIKDYQSQWNDFVQEGIDIRNGIASLTGYDSVAAKNQEATRKGFETMSQDTASELNGRFTALQMAGEEIKQHNIEQSQSLTNIVGSLDLSNSTLSSINGIADETRTIIAMSYLELQGIRENTGAIIKPIKEMASDIKDVKRNTEKL